VSVTRNLQRPADRMDVAYGVHYDGVNRATFITQTISA
jgi:urease alpha subunit